MNFHPSPVKITPRRARAALLLLSLLLLCSHPGIAAAQTADKINLPADRTAYTKLSSHAIPSSVPPAVDVFARQSISELSQHPPFTNWEDAGVEYVPLGPGTRSWLVMLNTDHIPLGYLIISSDNSGGLVLSEYGIGTDLPYSMNTLESSLAAAGLLLPGSPKDSDAILRFTPGTTIEALYDPALPRWKVNVKDKPARYIHAVSGEELTERTNPSVKAPHITSFKAQHVMNVSQSSPVISTLGDLDPYRNMLWITAQPLHITQPAAFKTQLRAGSKTAVIFTAGKRNAEYAAPLSLTGWQEWSSPQGSILYLIASHHGTELQRYLPADTLIGKGRFLPSP
ncbi:hypothetical protein [Paenibacillus lemnae]|uniref:Uncharacterized protein n=1 Tax=Paenibacillus lemnae TaxID=1330551 RepID=A0A848M528_PAELE|nr:hypothetical protein [Paenibacillus lemnae]NMO95341.1 hypothetical protein [Paenibacillus lemnae]